MAKSTQVQQSDPVEGDRKAAEKELEHQNLPNAREGGALETDDRDARIRARAYDLWEEAGRPEGRQEEHWELARQQIEAAERTKPEPPM